VKKYIILEGALIIRHYICLLKGDKIGGDNVIH